MFSEGIYEVRGNVLAGMLGVRRVLQHSIYLGIPTNIYRSRNVIFKTLVHQIKKKLKDWKARCRLSGEVGLNKIGNTHLLHELL